MDDKLAYLARIWEPRHKSDKNRMSGLKEGIEPRSKYTRLDTDTS